MAGPGAVTLPALGHHPAMGVTTMNERTCSRCGTSKPLDQFSRAAHGRDGYAAECKTCHDERREPPQREAVLVCLHCSAQFPNPARRGPDRKFCSTGCKEKWHRAERSRRRQEAPLRPCRKCGGSVAHRTGLPVCADCRIDDRDREYRRDAQLRSLYGITLADFNRMLAEQGGRCAICRVTAPGSRGTWRVDHDALTGQVRGLLCDACNTGIGKLRHDPEILRAAAEYLTRARAGRG